jgi:hypothetical protein
LGSEARKEIPFYELHDYCGSDYGLLGCDTTYNDKQPCIYKTNYKPQDGDPKYDSPVQDILCSFT